MLQNTFRFYKPCKLLQPYVRYYWLFRSNRPIATYTFPIGCPQIIFHKKTPFCIPELNTVQDKVTVSGQVNFSSHLCVTGSVETLVIVFQPYSMSLFLKVPVSLFYNQEISAYNLDNKSLNELAARISDCDDTAICINFIEEWLLSQIMDDTLSAHSWKRRVSIEYNIKRLNAAINKIYTAPQTSVMELSTVTCLSKKQFERSFRSFVGINPKEYIRIVRFQKALKFMQSPINASNFAQIAFASGYADQSHFIREFKVFCGYTPKDLLEITTPYSDLFTNPV